MSSEVERAVEFRALEAMLALAVNPRRQARLARLRVRIFRTAEAMDDGARAVRTRPRPSIAQR